MPPGMGELTCLQNLSDFKIGKAIKGVQKSGLDELARLQLRGELMIKFEEGIDNWDGDECWKPPVSLEFLGIESYPGNTIPNLSLLHNLSRLFLEECPKVKYLPPLRCLPNLKSLRIKDLKALEYIEEEGEEGNGCTTVAAGYINNNASFFPLLEELTMQNLPQLKGWRRRAVATIASSAGSSSPHLLLSFPLLSQLQIERCEELASFPLCPCVQTLNIGDVDGGEMQQLLSTITSPSSLEVLSIDRCRWLVSFPAKAVSSLKSCRIYECHSLENLRLLVSPFLKDLRIKKCDGLTSVEVEALPSLVSLKIASCQRLKSLRIACLSALRRFKISGYPKELQLWGIQPEKKCSVDWDSLPNLSELFVDRIPYLEEFPDCLRHRHALGQLEVYERSSE